MLLYVHRNRRLIRDSHLDFHTALELCNTGLVLLYVHRGELAY